MGLKNLPAEVDGHSMGKVMKRAGYDTFYGGKVHMCGALTPTQAGYDVYFRDARERLPAACIDFMKRKRKGPFFAVASFINPHDICFEYSARQGAKVHNLRELYHEAASLPLEKLPPLPDNDGIQKNEPAAIGAQLSSKAVTPTKIMREKYDERAWRIHRWIYHRLTENVDRHLGALLEGLKESGHAQDTVVIFTSDHGHMDASHRLASKSFFYEESVGVPLILKYEGGIPAGRIDRTHLVSTGLDILPTLCDYAGVKPPGHCLGASLRPLAEGQPVDAWRAYVASENQDARMIRTPNYKYCVFRDAGSKESLVDMKNDPGEMQNLIDDPRFQPALAAHRKLLADWSKLSCDQDAPVYLRG
jgi:choline-sulfatase